MLFYLQTNAWKAELTRLPTLSRQTTKTSVELSEDSEEEDLSTDTSCEDLPVPRLRNNLHQLGSPPTLPGQRFLTGAPGQTVHPTAVSFQQHHYYGRHGQSPAPAHFKVNHL